MSIRSLYHYLAIAALLLMFFSRPVSAKQDSLFFPQTGHTIKQPFLNYWRDHGGIELLGLPLNDSSSDIGAVQYFERARLVFDREHSSPLEPIVTMAPLGYTVLYNRYFNGVVTATTDVVPGSGSRSFIETGRTITGLFLSYWNNHGGEAQLGLPLTNPSIETSLANGKRYIVQYFTFARLEYHPEQASAKWRVMLGLIGREAYIVDQARTQFEANCGYPPDSMMANVLASNWPLEQELGCAIAAEQFLSGRAGYQQFEQAGVLLITSEQGRGDAYALYADGTYRNINYEGADIAGGNPPLPGPHFYRVANALGNLGAAIQPELWGDVWVRHFQHGVVFLDTTTNHPGPGERLYGHEAVSILLPNDAASGRWLTGMLPGIPPDSGGTAP